MDSATWMPVVGFEAHYSVSDRGLVRRDKAGMGAGVGRTLKPVITNYGYFVVTLSKLNRHHTPLVHRLVTAAFLGPCPAGKQCNHKNGIKTDNRAENLEYVTPKENIRHAHAFGLMNTSHGDNHWRAKLTFAKADWIRRIYRHGDQSQAELADCFAVNPRTIGNVVSGRTWVQPA